MMIDQGDDGKKLIKGSFTLSLLFGNIYQKKNNKSTIEGKKKR